RAGHALVALEHGIHPALGGGGGAGLAWRAALAGATVLAAGAGFGLRLGRRGSGARGCRHAGRLVAVAGGRRAGVSLARAAAVGPVVVLGCRACRQRRRVFALDSGAAADHACRSPLRVLRFLSAPSGHSRRPAAALAAHAGRAGLAAASAAAPVAGGLPVAEEL